MVYTGSHELLGFNPCGAGVVGTGGGGRRAGDGRQKHLRPEGVLVGKGKQQLDPEGRHECWRSFLPSSRDGPSAVQMRRLRLRDVDSLAQGHTARLYHHAVAQAVSSPLSAPFQGLTQRTVQSWSSVNIYCSNANSKSETLISLTASQELFPTHVTFSSE